ncbi:hypothetical protein L0668_17585 [Paraglaciecola aquimarina]|uniref:YcxB-like protein domain-containing protein n=1 Tax=Paraglaciecola algarum TaxID=3050085 RepID=A0ABS9DAE9_9ALTE|nr:hypothetical protein [Paraglaciecola sp. G1-23]MCF2949936.1 hypothetical protein [Paraglaciecola sp. G1-23]
MTNLANYFIYTKKQRSSSMSLVLNGGILFFLYLAAHKYLPYLTNDKSALSQLLDILDIAIWFVEAFIFGLAIWFWFENKEIKVCVTPTTLSYFDPTFSDVSWQVNISDITELKQITDTRQDFSSNLIVLKNGDTKQLMYGNYRGFDRRAFFDALVLANPNITVPEKIYSYKIQRPTWAKRIRNKFGINE